MITSVITNTLYPNIHKTLSNQNNIQSFISIVNKYVDKNIDKLSTIGPTKRILFSDIDRDNVYMLFNTNKQEITKVVNNTTYIKNNTIPADPFNIIMTLIIRYFKINKKEKEMNAAIIYLTLSMYPSIHFKYFRFEPNEQIMEYTINNLSNRFKIRQNNNLFITLVDTTVKSDTHYSQELIRGNDKDIADYILSYKTRLNGLMKNISEEFYKAHKEGKYFNYEEDIDNEDTFQIADNNSYLISRISDAVTMNLSVNGANEKIVRLSSKLGNISINDLRNTVHSICTKKETNNDIKEIVKAILYLYLFDGNNTKEDLYSTKFLAFSLEIYKKANTQNPNIVTIKNILDKWLNAYSATYRKTHAVSTINGFRKALFVFFVFTIQKTQV